jgi:hypothetical protein
MTSYGMLRRVTLVRTEVWEELSAFIIIVTIIGGLGTNLAATSNRSTQLASVATTAKRRYIPEDGILHSLYRENLKSYIRNTSYTVCDRLDPCPSI